MSEHYIKFENVKKSYGNGNAQINALDGVDFEINKGEFCILLGSSGAGKTTLLNMLGGMDTVTSGNIEFDGDVKIAGNVLAIFINLREDCVQKIKGSGKFHTLDQIQGIIRHSEHIGIATGLGSAGEDTGIRPKDALHTHTHTGVIFRADPGDALP